MKKILTVLFLVFALSSCDKTNYDDGYKNGFNEGQIQGAEKGKTTGLKEGYDKGFNDGAKQNFKDISIIDSKASVFNNSSFEVFTYFSLGVFIIMIVLVIYFSIAHNLLDKTRLYGAINRKIIFGKFIFIFVGFLTGYITMQLINVTNLVFFDIENNSLKWTIVGITIPITYFLAVLIEKGIKADQFGIDIILITISSFILFYFFLFMTNVHLYIINKSFVSYWLLAVCLGGLIYSGIKIISTALKDARKSKNGTQQGI